MRPPGCSGGLGSRGRRNYFSGECRVHLAAPHAVEVRKEGYNLASRTVTVYAGQQTSVYFDLTAQTGTIAVTSSPEAAVYLDTAYQGTTSAASGQLTLSSIPVGAHRVDVLKEGYAPFTATALAGGTPSSRTMTAKSRQKTPGAGFLVGPPHSSAAATGRGALAGAPAGGRIRSQAMTNPTAARAATSGKTPR